MDKNPNRLTKEETSWLTRKVKHLVEKYGFGVDYREGKIVLYMPIYRRDDIKYGSV